MPAWHRRSVRVDFIGVLNRPTRCVIPADFQEGLLLITEGIDSDLWTLRIPRVLSRLGRFESDTRGVSRAGRGSLSSLGRALSALGPCPLLRAEEYGSGHSALFRYEDSDNQNREALPRCSDRPGVERQPTCRARRHGCRLGLTGAHAALAVSSAVLFRRPPRRVPTA